MALNNGYGYIEDIKLYGPPNAALAAILVGPRMQTIVDEFTYRVLTNYVARQAGERYKDPGRQKREGGHPPGQLLSSIEAGVEIGGFKRDRWVGYIKTGVVYGAATEYGRSAYAEYEGNKNLREALYSVLPHTP